MEQYELWRVNDERRIKDKRLDRFIKCTSSTRHHWWIIDDDEADLVASGSFKEITEFQGILRNKLGTSNKPPLPGTLQFMYQMYQAGVLEDMLTEQDA